MIKALKIAGIVVGVAACAAIITDIVVTTVATKKLAKEIKNVPNCNDEGETFCENSDCKECEFKEYCK